MNCKKAQDLIKTCFLDGELDKNTKNDVQNHINSCNNCRLLERNLQKISLVHLSENNQINPPDRVWNKIEDTINKGKALKEEKGILDWLEQLLPPFFVLPRPAPVYALAVTILVAALSLLLVYKPTSHNKEVNEYLLEQANFIQDLDSEDYLNGLENTFNSFI